jgi:hypothetical protein
MLPASGGGNPPPATPPPSNPFEVFGKAVVRRPLFDLLKFNKGDYLRGRYSEETPLGSEWVVVMPSLETGWIEWRESKPVNRFMGRLIEGFVRKPRHEMGQTDQAQWEQDGQGHPRDPFQLTNEVIFVSRDLSEVYLFTTSSKGGIGALGELAGHYGARIRQRPDDYPVVKLSSSSYAHSDRSIGRVKTPLFPIAAWVDRTPYDKAVEKNASASEEEEEAA